MHDYDGPKVIIQALRTDTFGSMKLTVPLPVYVFVKVFIVSFVLMSFAMFALGRLGLV